MANDQLEFFATCPQGFEHILADELKRLRAQSVRPLKGGVAFLERRRKATVCACGRALLRAFCALWVVLRPIAPRRSMMA